MVCVGTQCVPSVATCVVAKIYRPIVLSGDALALCECDLATSLEWRPYRLPCADIRHVLCYLPPLNSRISIHSILLQPHADAERCTTQSTHTRDATRRSPGAGSTADPSAIPLRPPRPEHHFELRPLPPTPTPPQSPGPPTGQKPCCSRYSAVSTPRLEPRYKVVVAFAVAARSSRGARQRS